MFFGIYMLLMKSRNLGGKKSRVVYAGTQRLKSSFIILLQLNKQKKYLCVDENYSMQLYQVRAATAAIQNCEDLPRFPFDTPQLRQKDIFDLLQYVFGFQVHIHTFQQFDIRSSKCFVWFIFYTACCHMEQLKLLLVLSHLFYPVCFYRFS